MCHDNVCFAIDGNSSISSDEFDYETNFVVNAASSISKDQRTELSIEYSTSIVPITGLTPWFAGFHSLVLSAARSVGTLFLFVGANLCFSQVMRRYDEANRPRC